jgi:FtsP/CotA-like multicopper oxidase with cupredoxin domain
VLPAVAWRPNLLSCLFLSVSLAAVVARAATVRHDWDISYQFVHSVCVRKLAVTINGQTPGPIIRATEGDTVVVRVKNSLLTARPSTGTASGRWACRGRTARRA